MAPKKAKKISLNEFLGDSTLGSWADEMESLPNAPAARIDEEPGERFGRRDDFLTSRPDRQNLPPRDDVPLPTQPPYTAFIGNLAFDLTEAELQQFFSGLKTKSVKIIKDKDEKPKGFGYIEFEELEGLKDALSKTGSNFSGRTIRVSVAEPPKERSGFGTAEDNAKFENPWRRDGPLPDLPHSRDPSRRRFDGPSNTDRQAFSASDTLDQWRSSKPLKASEPDAPTRRKASGLVAPESQAGAADKEDVWTIGSRFKPSANGASEELSGRSVTNRAKSDMGPPRESPSDEGDWRSSARPQKPNPRGSVSPNNSTPPTPQLARKKLELLPRSGNASVSPSPLSSPKMGPTPPISNAPRANPFGGARPVDVSSRDREVAERIEREREVNQPKLALSRTSSRTGVERSSLNQPQTPPTSTVNVQSKVNSSKPPGPSLVPSVRPSLSFANVAAKKEGSRKDQNVDQNSEIEILTENVARPEI